MSLKKLDSRKLIIGVVSAALIVVNDLLGGHVSDTALYAASGVLGACIIGLGIADARHLLGHQGPTTGSA